MVNCPLTQETRGMIGKREFSVMKADAFMINAARGAIIDEASLIGALRERKIAGAALDVVSKEPVMSDHPLLQFDNVVITPHIGWYPEESLEEVRLKAVENVIRVLKGNLPNYPINPEVWTPSYN